MKTNNLAGSQYNEHREWSELRACSPEATAEEPVGIALGLRHHLKKSAWRAVPWMVAIALCLSMCSCGSTKVATQLDRDVCVDTVYLSNVQYDSIYICQDHVSEHHLGTLPANLTPEQYLNTPMRTDTLYKKIRVSSIATSS